MDDVTNCEATAHGVEVATAYGKRITCGKCRRRWTKIWHVDRGYKPSFIAVHWVEEKYTTMGDPGGW